MIHVHVKLAFKTFSRIQKKNYFMHKLSKWYFVLILHKTFFLYIYMQWNWNTPHHVRKCLALFTVAEEGLLLDIGWFVFFLKRFQEHGRKIFLKIKNYHNDIFFFNFLIKHSCTCTSNNDLFLEIYFTLKMMSNNRYIKIVEGRGTYLRCQKGEWTV